MKKISFLLVMLTTILTVLLSLSSCEKMGENDGVRGFWRLVSVKTGDIETDVTNDNIFWGLQNGIISIRCYSATFAQFEGGEPCNELIGKYHIGSNILAFDELYEHYDNHDERIQEISQSMKKCGIIKENPQFAVIEKSADRLTLKCDDTILTLIQN